MVKCYVSGVLQKVVPSRDGANDCLNIQVAEGSKYTVSVLKCPCGEFSGLVGKEVCVSCVPRAYYDSVKNKAKVFYYYVRPDKVIE